jgi:hypothetical protein
MTAEIAIMNKEGLAFAADSAVTVRHSQGHKIFTSANKIFCLANHEPLGIMIYGNSHFMGIPWETLIKEFRLSKRKNEYEFLDDCVNEFFQFLRDHLDFFSIDSQIEYAQGMYLGILNGLLTEIERRIQDVIQEDSEISEEEISKICQSEILNLSNQLENSPFLGESTVETEREFIERELESIKKNIAHVFENLPIPKESLEALTKICGGAVFRSCQAITRYGTTGVVIGGFGKKELFPSIQSFAFEGVVKNKLLFIKEDNKSDKITVSNGASLTPFAQSEMVSTFIRGIDPNFSEIILREFEKIVVKWPRDIVVNEGFEGEVDIKKISETNKDLFREFMHKITEYQRNSFISPIVNVIGMLPKPELASVAESLVSLTTLKRRVSMDIESVGGPIDVAVISKGDGFIWIKRKHYFEPALNQKYIGSLFKNER